MVTSAPAGIDCGATCNGAFPQGGVVALKATPAVDSLFVDWGGDADCSDGVVTMDGAKNCTATFTLSERTLTVVKNLVPSTDEGRFTMNANGITGAAGGDGANAVATVAVGASVNFSEVAEIGAALTDYTTTFRCNDPAKTVGTTTSGSLIMPDADVTCTFTNTRNPVATYMLSVTVAESGVVTSAPAGIDCGSTCSASFPEGGVVSLKALSAADSLFIDWDGDADCSDGVVTMDGPKSCTATFAPIVAKRYLPIAMQALQTDPLIDSAFAAIESRPAVVGESFFSAPIILNRATLPADGRFYLSGAPDRVQELWVDDLIVVVKNGSELFSHDFVGAPQVGDEVSDSSILKLTPDALELSRSVAEEMAAGGSTLEYRDVYGGLVGASEVWFVWVP